MGDKQFKRVDAVKKGDIVSTPKGPARIVCVFKTVTRNGYMRLCHLENGLIITPWHPMKYKGIWTFPEDI